MPKKPPELSALEVKRLTRPGLHAVGGVAGLFLAVSDGGARSWILRYSTPEVRYSQKGNAYYARRDLGLGGFPDVTLAQAREKGRELREKIRQGIDPAEERRAAREAWRVGLAKKISFEQAARKAHAAKESEFRNAKHRKDWISSLERHALPVIGSLPVAEIELPHILKVLDPIWRERTETATRVRQRLESVLAWATVSGYRSGENPARWDGNLKEVLPAPNKIRKVRHHRALPWQEVPEFMQALRKREGMASLALQFAILTAARSGEVRGAQWDEIDTQGRIWTVPADRIKAGKQHRVPLSDDALVVLEAVPRMEGSNHIFTAPRGGALSDMTLAAVLKRMKVDATVHGFRSSFKDWARNRTAYPDEVSELALAHVNSDATRAAYARDELLPQRQRLMADWARFCCEGLPGGDVVGIREG
ncbi:tyrosine-type recombinase/integrase [Aquisalimonas asiatica]|uniref:Integrase n=1 Tax=Aquisalimonas asiatica TaxID=406100 RepID=A0A1H8QP65_9GAMM|nr:site-specific integrase [Aquisalimonas asiatica]SEO55623.1 Integrase [Aquisalimonas asiatica]